MTIPTDGGPAVHDRFDRIEALLHRYPAIAETERAELKRWFTKEATAFEVASLSSKDELRAYLERLEEAAHGCDVAHPGDSSQPQSSVGEETRCKLR